MIIFDENPKNKTKQLIFFCDSKIDCFFIMIKIKIIRKIQRFL